jgi:transcriptional regulator with XRE-family HTH domain
MNLQGLQREFKEATLGGRLRILRRISGKSQAAIAKRAGLNLRTISLWENDKSKPETENLLTICNVYGIEIQDLLVKGQANG